MVAYPVQLIVTPPGRRSRFLAVLGVLLPLKVLLAFPVLFLMVMASFAASLLVWVSYVVVLFTGQMPDGLQTGLAGILRWSVWIVAWLWGLTDSYPMSSAIGACDLATDAPRARSRVLALLGAVFYLKSVLLLPATLAVSILTLAGTVLAWVGYWIVLFTGGLPVGLHAFLAGILRWSSRTVAWLWGLTDQYPPFSLQA